MMDVKWRANGNALPTQNTSSGLGKMHLPHIRKDHKEMTVKKEKRTSVKAASDLWLNSIWLVGQASRSDLSWGCNSRGNKILQIFSGGVLH